MKLGLGPGPPVDAALKSHSYLGAFLELPGGTLLALSTRLFRWMPLDAAVVSWAGAQSADMCTELGIHIFLTRPEKVRGFRK